MKIGKELEKILSRTYSPDSNIERRMGRYDIAVKTDNQGRPILLFIGQKTAQGRIKGERFSRRLITDDSGNVIKDHWDNQGGVS